MIVFRKTRIIRSMPRFLARLFRSRYVIVDVPVGFMRATREQVETWRSHR